jgi:hypothetical protein
MEVSGQQHVPSDLHPETKPDIHLIGASVGPRVDLDGLEDRDPLPFPGLELRMVQRVA